MILNNSSTLCSFSISIMFDPLSLSFCREPILIHLVPIKDIGDINFSQPKMSFSKEEMKNTARLIREAI